MVATGSQQQNTPGVRQAFDWPRGHYPLVGEPVVGREYDRLAVCVSHQGQHAWYTDSRDPTTGWCVVLDGGRLPPSFLCRAPAPASGQNGVPGAEVDRDLLNELMLDAYQRGWDDARAERSR